MKPTLDFFLSLIALVASAPVILGCMIAIRFTSLGPAIFRQVRVGRNEKPFTCFNLRTMYANTGDWPSHEADEAAITPFGRNLRRTKLDELPQLWNILTGDMSSVGPRPCLPSQKALIDARRARGLYSIRPGITGVSQIAGGRHVPTGGIGGMRRHLSVGHIDSDRSSTDYRDRPRSRPRRPRKSES
ncbi:sugar transferase [Aurantimonas sp. A3-2-R12]|uniref:sugar transferase n=1 Tax=Aurantimonas sp. A3-2-R12 TaxID=3114362 RepID=UPI002E184EBB|nr:sugar transferase [Aurantimonas sp. A3-2-R12]